MTPGPRTRSPRRAGERAGRRVAATVPITPALRAAADRRAARAPAALGVAAGERVSTLRWHLQYKLPSHGHPLRAAPGGRHHHPERRRQAVPRLDSGLRPLEIGLGRLVGRAVTVAAADDLMPVLDGLARAGVGDVLVVDGGGSPRALAGELFGSEALRRGLAGIVIDGACRDTAENQLRQLAAAVLRPRSTARARPRRQVRVPGEPGAVRWAASTSRPATCSWATTTGSSSGRPTSSPRARRRRRAAGRPRPRCCRRSRAARACSGRLDYEQHLARLRAGEVSALRVRRLGDRAVAAKTRSSACCTASEWEPAKKLSSDRGRSAGPPRRARAPRSSALSWPAPTSRVAVIVTCLAGGRGRSGVVGVGVPVGVGGHLEGVEVGLAPRRCRRDRRGVADEELQAVGRIRARSRGPTRPRPPWPLRSPGRSGALRAGVGVQGSFAVVRRRRGRCPGRRCHGASCARIALPTSDRRR